MNTYRIKLEVKRTETEREDWPTAPNRYDDYFRAEFSADEALEVLTFLYDLRRRYEQKAMKRSIT